MTSKTLHLIPEVDHLLLALLRSIPREDWDKPTLAGKWLVRDVAAHLLDVAMRSVSMYRDGHQGEKAGQIDGYVSLVSFLDELNGTWVKAFRRVSPPQIIQYLEPAMAAQFKAFSALDPKAEAIFSVAWAGEDLSTNAFHIDREYTEKFHHQLQIREALGKVDVLMTPRLFIPFIEVLLQGLPHVYKDVNAPEGTKIQFMIHGAGEGVWTLIKKENGWQLIPGGQAAADSEVSMPADIAWKLFTKGISIQHAAKKVKWKGNEALALHCLQMVSVMAVR